jgi:hypothetical protein
MTAFCQTKTYSVVLGVSLGCPGLVSTNEMACGFVCLCCAVLTSEWPCYTNEKSSDVKSSLLAKCCGQSNDYVACPNGRCPVLFRSPQPHQSDTIIHQLQEYLHGPDRLATLQPPTLMDNAFRHQLFFPTHFLKHEELQSPRGLLLLPNNLFFRAFKSEKLL